MVFFTKIRPTDWPKAARKTIEKLLKKTSLKLLPKKQKLQINQSGSFKQFPHQNLEIVYPPFDLQILGRDFQCRFPQTPPGCLPVARECLGEKIEVKEIWTKNRGENPTELVNETIWNTF